MIETFLSDTFAHSFLFLIKYRTWSYEKLVNTQKLYAIYLFIYLFIYLLIYSFKSLFFKFCSQVVKNID